jgi:hypothetical protein
LFVNEKKHEAETGANAQMFVDVLLLSLGLIVGFPSSFRAPLCHQSFPMACTSSSGPWKNTLTIRLQPVELDWRRDDVVLLLPDGRDDDGFEDSPETVDECLRVEGPANDDCDDLESFGLVFEVLEELWERRKLKVCLGLSTSLTLN